MLINKIEKKQNGFSLIELLAVVGIGGALIAGALLLINDVNSKKDIKQHSENISAIYANMSSLFTDEEVVSDVKSLVVSGVFPSTLNINSTKTIVKTKDGGTVTITPNTTGGYLLRYPKIKKTSCVEVIKNQKRIGWDNWSVADGVTSAVANKQFSVQADSGLSAIAVECAKGTNDWVSLSFEME